MSRPLSPELREQLEQALCVCKQQEPCATHSEISRHLVDKVAPILQSVDENAYRRGRQTQPYHTEVWTRTVDGTTHKAFMCIEDEAEVVPMTYELAAQLLTETGWSKVERVGS